MSYKERKSVKSPLSPDLDFVKFATAQEMELPENIQDDAIAFYCKDCRSLVAVEKKGASLQFQCKVCGSSRIAFGTDDSLKNFYKIH